MKKSFIDKIQKDLIDLLRKSGGKKPLCLLVQDSCSEISRLVGCWILEKRPKVKIYILKGKEVKDSNQSHDVLVVEEDNVFYLIDPTVWQFFKNKKEIYLGFFYSIDNALYFLNEMYSGKWGISETLNKNSCKQKDKWTDVIIENIKNSLPSMKKINIRRLKLSDADSFCNLATDEELRDNLPYPNRLKHKDNTLEYVQEFINTANKLWEKKECQFVIEDKGAKNTIGFIGLLKLDWKSKKAEVGYWISRKYRGKGFAKEALGQILDFAFNELKLKKVYAEVNSLNISSCKLLEKCGFKLEKRIKKDHKINGKWTDQLFYEIF